MKKLLLSFLLLAFFLSCEKKTDCYTCTMTVITTYSGGGYAGHSDKDVYKIKDQCGVTDEFIDQLERTQTEVSTYTAGTETITTNQVLKCEKQ
jgi:hypothetical protein